MYHDESDPPVIHVFEYDPSVREFKVNRHLSVIPKAAITYLPEEYYKFSQRDKDEFFKNQQFAETMNRLIANFQRRDTKNNIIRLQEELDGLAAQTNPLKKCLSMYKIKEKMDKIENNTKEEEQQAKKKKDEQAHANEIESLKKGKKGAKTTGSRGGAQPMAMMMGEGKDISIEQEGRLRYKILTNFVNAYKDKMFLSNSPGKGPGGNDIMTLEDLKIHT